MTQTSTLPIRSSDLLVRGAVYTVLGSMSGQVGATFRGRFGAELAFRTALGEHWTVTVADFRGAEAH